MSPISRKIFRDKIPTSYFLCRNGRLLGWLHSVIIVNRIPMESSKQHNPSFWLLILLNRTFAWSFVPCSCTFSCLPWCSCTCISRVCSRRHRHSTAPSTFYKLGAPGHLTPVRLAANYMQHCIWYTTVLFMSRISKFVSESCSLNTWRLH